MLADEGRTPARASAHICLKNVCDLKTPVCPPGELCAVQGPKGSTESRRLGPRSELPLSRAWGPEGAGGGQELAGLWQADVYLPGCRCWCSCSAWLFRC